MKSVRLIYFALLLIARWCGAADHPPEDTFLILCYHDIPKNVQQDDYGVDRETFVQQIEYLRTHGYNFISLEEVRQAHSAGKPLPPKAVLLTFDDGYRSFHEFVFPLLEMYGYPCVLSIVTDWLNTPPKGITLPLMTWRQLAEVAKSGLVEIASHTDNIHQGIVYNPQGNESWAAVSRKYDPQTKAYETENEYQTRIRADLRKSRLELKRNLGIDVRAIVWPFGEYNQITMEEAKSCGFDSMFVLEDRRASAGDLEMLSRYIVVNNPSIADFIEPLKENREDPWQQRILRANLDMIYDPDPVQQEKNLDRFIERVVRLQVNTVYLQAYCDENGDGNVSSVYFPNRVLPMKADLFNRVVNQLAIREILVYGWMPLLNITLPNEKNNDFLRVRELNRGNNRPTTSWHRHLSPFSTEAVDNLTMLYGDMAAHARIDGVVFHDDGYLNDVEDSDPAAQEEYRAISGDEDIPNERLSGEQEKEWTEVKTRKLIAVTDTLKGAVRRYRPQARFARTLSAPVAPDPASEERLARNYAESLKTYDYTVLMAYPFRKKEVKHQERWLKRLSEITKSFPDGPAKTVIKVQTYDREKKQWIDANTVCRWMRALVSRGVRHIAYYPDNYAEDKPDMRSIRLAVSTEDFPFIRSAK